MTAPPPKSWAIPGVRAFASLSRRVRALIISAVAFLALFGLTITLPVPYVVESPGPTYNTLGTDGFGKQIIVINGTTVKRTTGNLNMTTVDLNTAKQTAFDVLVAWLRSDEVVVPKEAIFPPGQTEQQVNQQNTQQFTESQDDAIAAASCELGYPKRFGVATVSSTGAAYGKLQPSDLIQTVDGKNTDTSDLLLAALQQIKPGTTVTVGFTRYGKAEDVAVTLGPPVAGRTGGSLGISVSDVICQAPFEMDLGLGNQIGGPSAGLMFALGIMDKVGSVDLTHGMFIAGTGTIDTSGAVGPIGGIALKMIAARRAGATVFLAPAGNCTEVRGATPGGLQVVKVATLHDAVQDLESLAAGKAVPGC